MKQNIIIFGLMASAGLTFCQLPKATAYNLRPSTESTIEKSQIISYEGTDEDGETEEVENKK
ncbi:MULTISPECIES: hypothetical protein [Okeania]|uniref:Uncharacterized protein n=2 Tax=Okeania TaxID=1458928 RepID=A0A3N6NN13_9CYAN|nr:MULTISPECIES: hypothetical protein [Okeania]NET16944.1 hypothetical protein [Okeania sp. SIO1H6]NES76738.1 hypothetical protein [Okeania sp. SIO1H4]NES89478.1 hypothetical protein [Okeania sp. SIO2B9]NET20664.1 hypothetical protein [Okeania sp. SIO1H5]RQH17122.1 hypothetical protein D4Z78_18150 [Okeania hirsuta]